MTDTVPRSPEPTEAYANAPDFMTENQAVINIGLAAAAEGRQLDTDREWLLRQAALIDRTALGIGLPDRDDALPDSPLSGFLGGETEKNAAKTAFLLLQHDRAHGGFLGDIGPDAIEWDAEGGPRVYVRDEYRLWREQQQAQAVAEVGPLMREMYEVSNLGTIHAQAAARGKPYPHNEVLTLARRRVGIMRRMVDYGEGDLLMNLINAERELTELETLPGGTATA